jgi:hypothetical protein
MMEQSEFKPSEHAKEMLLMGASPEEILKAVQEEELAENQQKSIPRLVATKDLSAQVPNSQSKMARAAIK